MQPNTKHFELLDHLEIDIDYTFEKLATVAIMFESLRHTYAISKAEIDRLGSPTRLCDMEKELLAAYDDLGLETFRLERQMAKLEKRLRKLRSLSSSDIMSRAAPSVTPPTTTQCFHDAAATLDTPISSCCPTSPATEMLYQQHQPTQAMTKSYPEDRDQATSLPAFSTSPNVTCACVTSDGASRPSTLV